MSDSNNIKAVNNPKSPSLIKGGVYEDRIVNIKPVAETPKPQPKKQ